MSTQYVVYPQGSSGSGSGSTKIQNSSGIVIDPATESSLAAVKNAVQGVLLVDQKGRDRIGELYVDYTLNNVDTISWQVVTLGIALPGDEIDIFDSSGRVMELGIGAPGSETRILLISPGGNGRLPLKTDPFTSFSIRAVDGNAISGFLIANIWGAGR